MDESQLLNRFLELEASSKWLQIQIQTWPDGNEKNEYVRQKAEVDATIEIFKNRLQNIENKNISPVVQRTILNQLNQYIISIGKFREPIFLSKYESISMENSLFINLASRIQQISIIKQIGIAIPIFEYTYSEENSVKIEIFLNYLNQEITNIANIEDVNFIKLISFYKNFQKRLNHQFL